MQSILRNQSINLLSAIGLSVVIVALVLSTTARGQQDDSNVPMRIGAQRLHDGRTEFGLQVWDGEQWGETVLPGSRFFPSTARVGRWLNSSFLTLESNHVVRISAKLLDDDRIEFALQQQIGEEWFGRLLPRPRFFPADANAERWLYSGRIELVGHVSAASNNIATTSSSPTQTPAPNTAIGGVDGTITIRQLEYGYTIELPDGWVQEREDAFSKASPWSGLVISSQILPSEYNAEQYSLLLQEDLRSGWWRSASLLEFTSVEAGLNGDHQTRLIRYRVQVSPEHCVVNVAELIAVAQILSGNPHGFRVRAWMCERDVPRYGRTREEILESFRIHTQPAAYYRQFMLVNGITVKASSAVEPPAVEAGAEIVAAMLSGLLLSGRGDIVRCMARKGAELAIIPDDQTLTSLPEYEYIRGTSDFTGRSRDTFEIRGAGAVPGQPVSSAGEEQLLGRIGPQHPYYPFRGLVAVHEFAHAIQNLCFTARDHELWNEFYADAVRTELFPGSHMMFDVMEFFAVFSTGYFEVTFEFGQELRRDSLRDQFPRVVSALDELYGSATLPKQYRTRLERQQ